MSAGEEGFDGMDEVVGWKVDVENRDTSQMRELDRGAPRGELLECTHLP
jgi:hypothetical protein